MKRRWLLRLAWALWGFVVASLAVDMLVAVVDWAGTAAHGGVFIFVAFTAFVLAFSTVGVLIVTRQPGNPVGWLLSACAVGYALAGLTQTYAGYGLAARPNVFPGATLADWAASWMFLTGAGPAATFLLLLFPTGKLLSRRWRAVGWLAGAGMALIVVSTALAPGPIGGDRQAPANPVGIPGREQALRVAATVGGVALSIAIFGSVVSLIVRFRRARLVERQQLKWLSYAAVLVGVAVLVGQLVFTVWGSTPLTTNVVNAVTTGSLACVPVAVGIAILRYRLYDIDYLISRTLSYALLTGVITAVYLAVVVVIGTLIGSRGKPNLPLIIVGTAVVAVAIQPARERSRQVANRLVYGKRATPYEILSEFSRGMAGASTDDSLLRMARLVVEATGAVKATVWLRLGDMLQPQAAWPQAGPLPEPIALEGRDLEEALVVPEARGHAFPVAYEDELLGALTVTTSPSEPLTLGGEQLIADLATRTGLGLRFERMKERALFARALASFLPPEVAELVEASPSALSLREELEATILFSDIRGFSTLAERLPPREVAEVVGRHLTAMVEVVTSHGGVLDKFAGDAVMAVFGAPRPTQDHAQRALGCAVAMQRRQATLNGDAERGGLPVFQIGIGVNTGTVIAGTLGGPGRLDYTVLGDAVNVAQRLQSEAVGGEILASAITVGQAGTDRAEPVGLKHLKGRQELVDVYRIRWADTPTARPSGETAYAE
jgi:class 3 adenylate cyclase/cytochrome b subunit of formate dehydrogenase